MSELPRLHTPQEIADSLGCSEWWVKDRARRREIPSTKVAGAYRFTAQQWAEIVETYAQRPESTPEPSVVAPRRRAQRPAQPANAVVPLQARPPRRRPKAG